VREPRRAEGGLGNSPGQVVPAWVADAYLWGTANPWATRKGSPDIPKTSLRCGRWFGEFGRSKGKASVPRHQQEGKSMRTWIMTLRVLLGAAVLTSAAIVVAGGGVTGQPALPGQGVPDSEAATLVGGACGTELVLSCFDHTTIDPKCKMQNVNLYSGTGDWQSDKEDYCGAIVNKVKQCGKTDVTSKKCATGE